MTADRCACGKEVETGRLVAGHKYFINALVSLPGGLLASGASDGTIVVWRIVDAV